MFFNKNKEYDLNLKSLKEINQRLIDEQIESFEIILSFKKYKNFERFMNTVIKKFWDLSEDKVNRTCQHELDHYIQAKQHKFTANFQIKITRQVISRKENTSETTMIPSVKIHGKDTSNLNKQELEKYFDIVLAPKEPSESDLIYAEYILKRIEDL